MAAGALGGHAGRMDIVELSVEDTPAVAGAFTLALTPACGRYQARRHRAPEPGAARW